MTSVCIVAHNAYASLTGEVGHIGGVELQTAMLAKYLAGAGHTVSFVTWRPDTINSYSIDGVNYVPLCSETDGFPALRFFHPRWTSLRKALTSVDADVYYHNGAEYVTGQVALHCRSRGRGFVFSTASDTDCDASLPDLVTFREKMLYRFGIKNATRIITQTQKQQKMLSESFSLSSTVLPMPCDFIAQFDNSKQVNVSKALWVGRIIPSKRLEAYLDIASSIPDIEFHIAGGADDDLQYAQSVIERARSTPNVVYHGALNRGRLNDLYKVVDVFVCTSEIEGFPNTFLEAWANGLPIISTFDPDNLIEKFTLGYSVAHPQQIVSKIQQLKNSPKLALQLGNRCFRHFLEHHDTRVALPRFESVLLAAATRRS